MLNGLVIEGIKVENFIDQKKELLRHYIKAIEENLEFLGSHVAIPLKAYKDSRALLKSLKDLLKEIGI